MENPHYGEWWELGISGYDAARVGLELGEPTLRRVVGIKDFRCVRAAQWVELAIGVRDRGTAGRNHTNLRYYDAANRTYIISIKAHSNQTNRFTNALRRRKPRPGGMRVSD